MRKMTKTNYTNAHIINATEANKIIGNILDRAGAVLRSLLHIETNSSTIVELYKIASDGAEIFIDIETGNYIKLAGDIVEDVKEL